MYIDTLGSSTLTESSETNYGGSTTDSQDELGKDAFLTLLVAQMQNQDPLNPMDSTQFTSQLAQYSSLEQLYNVNDNLTAIQDGQSGLSNYSALDFMGKEIQINGNELTLANGAVSSGGFSLEESANCNVNILDSDGNLVKTLSMGDIDAGTHELQWDGLDENGNTLADGNYTFEISAVGESGETASVEPYMSGIVDRVSLENNTPILYVGNESVAIDDVKDICFQPDGNT